MPSSCQYSLIYNGSTYFLSSSWKLNFGPKGWSIKLEVFSGQLAVAQLAVRRIPVQQAFNLNAIWDTFWNLKDHDSMTNYRPVIGHRKRLNGK